MAVNQVLGFQFEPIKRRVSDKNNSDRTTAVMTTMEAGKQ